MAKRLFLTGPSCSGKSTLAVYISGYYGLEYADTDLLIQEKTGKSIADLFKDLGEDGFREIESEVLLDCKASVVATGGGAVLLKNNRALMAREKVVLLLASPDILAERLQQSYMRPLLAGNSLADIDKMLHARAYAYTLADTVINTGLLNVEQSAVLALDGIV